MALKSLAGACACAVLALAASASAANIPWSQQTVDSLSSSVPLYLRGMTIGQAPTLVYLNALPNSYGGSVVVSHQLPSGLWTSDLLLRGSATSFYYVLDAASDGHGGGYVAAASGTPAFQGPGSIALVGNSGGGWRVLFQNTSGFQYGNNVQFGSASGSVVAQYNSASPSDPGGPPLYLQNVNGTWTESSKAPDGFAPLHPDSATIDGILAEVQADPARPTLHYRELHGTTWTDQTLAVPSNIEHVLQPTLFSVNGLPSIGYIGEFSSGMAAVIYLHMTPTPGDANHDGAVNFGDLLTLAEHYGASGCDWSSGDFSGDGKVGFDDLVALAAHYGVGSNSPSPSSSMPVPEPAAGLGCTVILLATLRRRRQRDKIQETVVCTRGA